MKNDGCFVFALGGNALGNTPLEQRKIVQKTAKVIVDFALKGQKVVVCHGNGPQVGMINLAFTLAQNQQTGQNIPDLPLPEAGSMSQGYIGFHLQNAILNELSHRHARLKVATLVTQVLVNKTDPAFKKPTKPIGAFYSQAEADKLSKQYGWFFQKDANRGWRRFVASPTPQKILEKDAIRTLLDDNHIVIAGGGGGIPVYQEKDHYLPIGAVIDKDFTAAKLANDLAAEGFWILTAVDCVSLNYGQSNQIDLKQINVAEMEKYYNLGHFGTGSMAPKVKAAISFVKTNPDKRAIITSLEHCIENVQNHRATIIVAQ